MNSEVTSKVTRMSVSLLVFEVIKEIWKFLTYEDVSNMGGSCLATYLANF